MRSLLAAALLVSSCAGVAPASPARKAPPICTTRCGLTAHVPAASCEQLQRLEGDAVAAFGRYVDAWTMSQVCESFRGWEIVVHKAQGADILCGEDAWMLEPFKFCVYGYTRVATRQVEVADTTWRTNALAHELVHVADVSIRKDVGHCRWKARGIKAALKRITGEEDPSKPDEGCPDAPPKADAGTPDAGD